MLNSQLDHATRTETDAQLESGGGNTVELPGESDWREAREAIAGAVQVDIRFGKFNDGRGFTLAAHLRERAGFKGHLRAVGALIPDQAQFLKRVGFDAVSAPSPFPPSALPAVPTSACSTIAIATPRPSTSCATR